VTATRHTDDELAQLVTALESDLVERKRSAADRSGIRRNICAFANDLPGHGRPGVVFVGVEDDGRCAGLSVTDEMLRVLAQMGRDGNILPLPSMVVEKRLLAGCEVAVLIIQPSRDTPVRYQQRAFVKVGPTVRQATPEEEQRLAERRRASDLPFDLRPASGATLDDLDVDYLRTQYFPRAIAPEVLERNRRPLPQQLRSLRLAFGDTPSFGALLAFGRDPQTWVPGAYVQFLRVDGQRLTDAIRDQKVLTGRLEDVLRRLDELLEVNVSIRTDVTGATREIRRPDYPVRALQQLVRNAVMHRSYEGTNAPARIYWYSDRVEIQNPGGLYGTVTQQNFGTGATDYRNPLLAEIMHHLGFAQRFGLGLPTAYEELSKNGNPPPEFTFEPTHVAATVKPAP
jgi:ATP-dependent DNA helicase RecG